MVEPRTNAEIMRDLLEAVKAREWVETAIYSPRGGYFDGTRPTCEECGDGAGKTGDTHAADCKVAALIAETEAFLRVEDALEEERERAAKEPTS